MKKSILFILLFIASITTSYSQSNDAKSKAFYFSAEESYNNNKYSVALDLLKKSEEAGGASNAYIESLRVLCYGGQRKWIKAQESLEVCYSFNPSNDILKKLSPIIIKIDNEIEKEKEAKKQKLISDKIEKQKKIVKINKEKETLFFNNLDNQSNLRARKKEDKQLRVYTVGGQMKVVGGKVVRTPEYYGYADKNDYIIIKAQFDYAMPFSCGLAWVESNNKWGAINKDGQVIIPFKYYKQNDMFINDLSVIKNSNYLKGVINTKGKEIVPTQYKNIRIMNNGVIVASFPSGKMALYTYYGGILLNGTIDDLKFSNKGILMIKVGKVWVGIDNLGQKLTNKYYHDVRNFISENRWAVMYNNNWGFINKNGDEVIPCKYQTVRYFSENLCAIELNGKWGYLDINGEVDIPIKYDSASSFFEGKAVVELNGQTIIIDKKGNSIF